MTHSWGTRLRRSSRDNPRPSSPAKTARQQLGQRSEQLALQTLRAHGYVVHQLNARFPVGEIDIVAQDGSTLCFVEVRSTSSSQWGGPLASIRAQKQQRLIRASQRYLQRLRKPPQYVRFDVVAIQWTDPFTPTIELIRGAFQADGSLRSW